jgi:hypothetical protein
MAGEASAHEFAELYQFSTQPGHNVRDFHVTNQARVDIGNKYYNSTNQYCGE